MIITSGWKQEKRKKLHYLKAIFPVLIAGIRNCLRRFRILAVAPVAFVTGAFYGADRTLCRVTLLILFFNEIKDYKIQKNCVINKKNLIFKKNTYGDIILI